MQLVDLHYLFTNTNIFIKVVASWINYIGKHMNKYKNLFLLKLIKIYLI